MSGGAKIPFSVPRFLSEINTVLKIKSEQKSLKLIFQERIIGPEFIVSDPNRLRQILMNLIGNAIKFTNHGEVKVSSTVEKNNITFYVQDTGIGITELQQQQLFQNFNQGDNSVTRRFAGTGLGLALSRHLARKLGGDISLVQTDINHGTTFALKIPYMLPNNEELILSRNQSAKLMLEKNLFQKSILVVDDALDNQILIKTILTDWGFKVTLASNGQEAVDRVKTENFDLILMDMQMPVKDGYTACRELIVSNSDVPIVALTAHAMKEDRDLCLQAGCCDYITKPIKKNQLLLTIQKNLEHACA